MWGVDWIKAVWETEGRGERNTILYSLSDMDARTHKANILKAAGDLTEETPDYQGEPIYYRCTARNLMVTLTTQKYGMFYHDFPLPVTRAGQLTPSVPAPTADLNDLTHYSTVKSLAKAIETWFEAVLERDGRRIVTIYPIADWEAVIERFYAEEGGMATSTPDFVVQFMGGGSETYSLRFLGYGVYRHESPMRVFLYKESGIATLGALHNASIPKKLGVDQPATPPPVAPAPAPALSEDDIRVGLSSIIYDLAVEQVKVILKLGKDVTKIKLRGLTIDALQESFQGEEGFSPEFTISEYTYYRAKGGEGGEVNIPFHYDLLRTPDGFNVKLFFTQDSVNLDHDVHVSMSDIAKKLAAISAPQPKPAPTRKIDSTLTPQEALALAKRVKAWVIGEYEKRGELNKLDPWFSLVVTPDERYRDGVLSAAQGYVSGVSSNGTIEFQNIDGVLRVTLKIHGYDPVVKPFSLDEAAALSAPALPVSPDLLREAENANDGFGEELRFFRDLFDRTAARSQARFAPPAGGRRDFSRGRRPSQPHDYQPYQRDDVPGKRDVPMAGKGWRVAPAKSESVSTPASAPVMVSTPGQLVNVVREECRRVPDILRYDIPQKYEPFVRRVLAKGDKGSDSFSVKGYGVQLNVDGAKAYLIITKPNGTSRKYSYTLGFRSSVVAHVSAPQAAKPAPGNFRVTDRVSIIPAVGSLTTTEKREMPREDKEVLLKAAVPPPASQSELVPVPAPAPASLEMRLAKAIRDWLPLAVKAREGWTKDGPKVSAELVEKGTSSEAEIAAMLQTKSGIWKNGKVCVRCISGKNDGSTIHYPLRLSRVEGEVRIEVGIGRDPIRKNITLPRAGSVPPQRASYGDVDINNAKQIDKGLEYFFQEARRVLGIQGKKDLTEDECDQAVVLLLKEEGKTLSTETLRVWRAVAKAQGGLEGRKVFFPLAYDPKQGGWSQCLWYVAGPKGEIQRAAGHYSLSNNSVYISVQAILALLHDDRAIIVSRIAQYESLRFIGQERDLDGDDLAYLDYCQRVDKKAENDRAGRAMVRRVTAPALSQEYTAPNNVSQLLASTPIARRVTSGVPMIVTKLYDPPASPRDTSAFAEAAGHNGYGVIEVTQYNFGSDPKTVVVPADGTIKSADDLALQFHGILHHWVGNMLNVANPGLYAKNGGFNNFKDARVIFEGRRGEIRLAFDPGICYGLAQAMKTGEPVAATIILPPREKSSEAVTVNVVFVPYANNGDLVVTLADGPFFPAGGKANNNSFTLRALMKRVGNDRREDGGVKLGAAASGENIQTQSNGSAFTLDAGWSRPDIKGVRFRIVEIIP
jgi:hypothetical protein